VLTALLLAVVGMLLGLYMGIAADHRLLSVHVAVMLPGFVTLAIYGCLFRLWPSMKTTPLAQAQFWTGMIGAAAIMVGAYFFATMGSVPIVAIGSVLAIVAAVLMTWMFWTTDA
jgi:hypothetical protein